MTVFERLQDGQVVSNAALVAGKGTLVSGDGTRYVETTVGSNGKVWTADSTATGGGSWQTPAGGAPSGSAGGDLGSTYPNPTVASISNASQYASLVKSGDAAGGSLSGTYPNPGIKVESGVAILNGSGVVTVTPSIAATVLVANGDQATQPSGVIWSASAGGGSFTIQSSGGVVDGGKYVNWIAF